MPNAHVSLHLRYLPSLFKVVTVCNTLPSLANSVQHFFSIVDICWPLQGLWPVRLFVPLSPALALYKGREGSLFCAGYSLKVSRKDTEEWLKDSSREYWKARELLDVHFDWWESSCRPAEQHLGSIHGDILKRGAGSAEAPPSSTFLPRTQPYISCQLLSLNVKVHFAFISSVYLSNFPFHRGNFLV